MKILNRQLHPHFSLRNDESLNINIAETFKVSNKTMNNEGISISNSLTFPLLTIKCYTPLAWLALSWKHPRAFYFLQCVKISWYDAKHTNSCSQVGCLKSAKDWSSKSSIHFSFTLSDMFFYLVEIKLIGKIYQKHWYLNTNFTIGLNLNFNQWCSFNSKVYIFCPLPIDYYILIRTYLKGVFKSLGSFIQW